MNVSKNVNVMDKVKILEELLEMSVDPDCIHNVRDISIVYPIGFFATYLIMCMLILITRSVNLSSMIMNYVVHRIVR